MQILIGCRRSIRTIQWVMNNLWLDRVFFISGEGGVFSECLWILWANALLSSLQSHSSTASLCGQWHIVPTAQSVGTMLLSHHQGVAIHVHSFSRYLLNIYYGRENVKIWYIKDDQNKSPCLFSQQDRPTDKLWNCVIDKCSAKGRLDKMLQIVESSEVPYIRSSWWELWLFCSFSLSLRSSPLARGGAMEEFNLCV